MVNGQGVNQMKKYSVIRVLRNKGGQSCTVEVTFNNLDEASNFSTNLNRFYGNKVLNWVVDKY